MGIHTFTLDFLYESLKAAGITSLEDKMMMELGNQFLRRDARKSYGIVTGISKVYFLQQKCNHHSIDLNGLHGAIPLDMTEPIPIKKYMNQFDIITDFGCMEHICGAPDIRYTTEPYHIYHWQAWKNIYDMGKVGCVYIHILPLSESYPRHGAFHYDEEFFRKLCKLNGYRILSLYSKSIDPRTWKRTSLWACYVKESDTSFEPDADELKTWLYIRQKTGEYKLGG